MQASFHAQNSTYQRIKALDPALALELVAFAKSGELKELGVDGIKARFQARLEGEVSFTNDKDAQGSAIDYQALLVELEGKSTKELPAMRVTGNAAVRHASLQQDEANLKALCAATGINPPTVRALAATLEAEFLEAAGLARNIDADPALSALSSSMKEALVQALLTFGFAEPSTLAFVVRTLDAIVVQGHVPSPPPPPTTPPSSQTMLPPVSQATLDKLGAAATFEQLGGPDAERALLAIMDRDPALQNLRVEDKTEIANLIFKGLRETRLPIEVTVQTAVDEVLRTAVSQATLDKLAVVAMYEPAPGARPELALIDVINGDPTLAKLGLPQKGELAELIFAGMRESRLPLDVIVADAVDTILANGFQRTKEAVLALVTVLREEGIGGPSRGALFAQIQRFDVFATLSDPKKWQLVDNLVAISLHNQPPLNNLVRDAVDAALS
jgi:hypothetical protein